MHLTSWCRSKIFVLPPERTEEQGDRLVERWRAGMEPMHTLPLLPCQAHTHTHSLCWCLRFRLIPWVSLSLQLLLSLFCSFVGMAALVQCTLLFCAGYTVVFVEIIGIACLCGSRQFPLAVERFFWFFLVVVLLPAFPLDRFLFFSSLLFFPPLSAPSSLPCLSVCYMHVPAQKARCFSPWFFPCRCVSSWQGHMSFSCLA